MLDGNRWPENSSAPVGLVEPANSMAFIEGNPSALKEDPKNFR